MNNLKDGENHRRYSGVFDEQEWGGVLELYRHLSLRCLFDI